MSDIKILPNNRLCLTCVVRFGLWLPPVWSRSESERCPGSGQGERSAEGRAACRWSSELNHRSAEIGKMDDGGMTFRAVFPCRITLLCMIKFFACMKSD